MSFQCDKKKQNADFALRIMTVVTVMPFLIPRRRHHRHKHHKRHVHLSISTVRNIVMR